MQRIINLGDIFPINIQKTIGKLVQLIASKKQFANLDEITKQVMSVLHQNNQHIDEFKLGKLAENSFDDMFISAIEKATGIKLSIDEFNEAWDAKNASFQDILPSLNELIQFNKKSGNKAVMISFTNAKDIRFIMNMLIMNEIKFNHQDGHLTEIDGILLLTSFMLKKTKAELIELAIEQLKNAFSTLAKSMSGIFSDLQLEKSDIKYVRCVNRIDDPVLKIQLDEINTKVEQKAKENFVETIIWMRSEKTFTEILNDTSSQVKNLPLAAL